MSKIEKGRKLASVSESRGNKSGLGVRLGVTRLAFNAYAVNTPGRSGLFVAAAQRTFNAYAVNATGRAVLAGAVECWEIMVPACREFNLLVEWRYGKND